MGNSEGCYLSFVQTKRDPGYILLLNRTLLDWGVIVYDRLLKQKFTLRYITIIFNKRNE